MLFRFLTLFCLLVTSIQLPTNSVQRRCCRIKNQETMATAMGIQEIQSNTANTKWGNNVNAADNTLRHVFSSTTTKRCPDGWLRFRESCYFMERRKMQMSEAESNCQLKNATLFVPNSQEEFNVVMKSALPNFWSWIGLAQFEWMKQPNWQVYGGMEPAKLKWLVSPYSPTVNGWSAAAECVGYYNSEVKPAGYNYFYPCNLQFASICERNATLINSVLFPVKH